LHSVSQLSPDTHTQNAPTCRGMAVGVARVRRAPFSRALVFRIGAVAIGLAPFVIAELLFIRLDWGRPELSDDPFVGFRSVRPLFVLDTTRERYETAPARQTQFVPAAFAAHKPPNAFRIFVLGGSTVQGNPYSVPTSFTTWLELSLEAAAPERRWEVVNCGGISYATYRLVPIMQELVAYEPDMFIVYEGHNEFLEDRTYGSVKNMSPVRGGALAFASRLRLFNVLRGGYLEMTGQNAAPAPRDRAVLETEVEALLDYRGGLEFYHHDDAWRRGVIDHFQFNLRRMVQIARAARVRLLLMNPVCNLRDSPPFKSEHRTGLDETEIEEWESLWSEARQYYDGRHQLAVPLLQRATELDELFAGTHYDLAKCYEALGRMDDARHEFLLAKELDVCPLRVLEAMNQAVLEIARETGTPVVDAREIFERLSPGRIPGHEWLVDHVHPSIRGHQVLAAELVDAMVRCGIVRPQENWEETRDRQYADHLGTLDAIYYFRGQQHLDSLSRWAEGRITKERPPRPSQSMRTNP
jgi:tetratricopeptide (TPR) repeat protein